MNLPSIKTISRITDIETAKKIRTAMENYRDHSNPYAGITVSMQATIEHIDTLLDTYGVEYIKGSDGSPSITYCNAGDTYEDTVLFMAGRFIIGNWGGFVEAGNY